MVLDDGNTIVDVANRLCVGEGTLGNWMRQARIDRATAPGRPRRSEASWPRAAA